jgi:hypothetical protein
MGGNAVNHSEVFIIPLNAIRITQKRKFSQAEWDQHEWEYLRSGMAESDIVLDENNNLIDGYIWYLIAKHFELTAIPARYAHT